MNHKYGVAQASRFKNEKVIGWIEEAETVDEARKIAHEYDKPKYTDAEFYKDNKNLSIMFEINIAKFSQNPKLARWFVDTDTEGDMPPIFHTTEKEDFWGLGAKSSGVYKGKNWNGRILMCVRAALKRVFQNDVANLFSEPAPRSLDMAGLYTFFKDHGFADEKGVTRPLPNGTLIDRRYRVVAHKSTAGLGSYAGPFSYICVDELPRAVPLDRRIQSFLNLSLCEALRRALGNLQKALCSISTDSAGDWKDVFDQIDDVENKLFHGGKGDDAVHELRSRLTGWKGRADTKDSVACLVGSLLLEPAQPNESEIIFLKTFAHDADRNGIMHEINVCSLEQPEFIDKHICGISLASCAAPIETTLDGFGWVGLCARSPVIAMENCDGCDLFDFYNCEVHSMATAIQERIETLGFKISDRTTQVNTLLYAAAEFQTALFEAMVKVQRAKNVSTRSDFIQRLSCLIDPMLANAAKPAGCAEPEGYPALGTASLSWTKFTGLFQDKRKGGKHFRRFANWEAMVSFLNRAVDEYTRNQDKFGPSLNAVKWKYDIDFELEKKIMCAEVLKLEEHLILLKDLATVDRSEVRRWRAALHAFWPSLKNLHASLMLRYILELIHIWDWRRALEMLQKVGPDEDGTSKVTDSGKFDAPKGRDHLLESVASEQHNAGLKFLKCIGKTLCDDEKCIDPKLQYWPDELVNLLLEHVLTSRIDRLRWMEPQTIGKSLPCPPNVTRMIIVQVLRAIRNIHRCRRVHGDIKLENFNLTAVGQVKLLDFGYMLELNENQFPTSIEHPSYCSPQLKLLASQYSSINNKNHPLPFKTFDGNISAIFNEARLIKENLSGSDLHRAIANIGKHCTEAKPPDHITPGVVCAILKENDLWMVGNILQTIIDDYSDQNEPEVASMEAIVEKIRKYQIRSVGELLKDDWLKGSTLEESDRHELMELCMPLFIPQPSLARPRGLGGCFVPDIGYVNTGRGFWRVFRVGGGVKPEELSVGDEIVKIDGRPPPKLDGVKIAPDERTGAFYSEMTLSVRTRGPDGVTSEERPVVIRRTKMEPAEAAKADPDRFRDYLWREGGERWLQLYEKQSIPRKELLKHFTRWWGLHSGGIQFDELLKNWERRGWIKMDSDAAESIRLDRKMVPPGHVT